MLLHIFEASAATIVGAAVLLAVLGIIAYIVLTSGGAPSRRA